MSQVNATSSAPIVRGDRGPASADDGGEGFDRPNLGQAVAVEGLGLEGLAAMLAIQSAQDQASINRKMAREARQAQIAKLDEQRDDLYEKASKMRTEAYFNAVVNAVGALSIVAFGEKEVTKMSVDSLTSLSKGVWGTKAIESEADATAAAARAKEAESECDAYNSNAKQVEGMVDKAQQALQSFVAERAATRRAILRGG